jgi:glycoside/pentoside/hexuronide:cation symporter, GPH family
VRPRLPRWVTIVYGAGYGGTIIVERLVFTWLYFVWVGGVAPGGRPYLAPVAFSVLVLAGRVVDAVTDPVVARWSDNHHGRLGRRRPFLLWSAAPLVGVGVWLFLPPVEGPSLLNAVHLGIGLCVFYLLLTCYLAPYLALLADLSPSVSDRVDLATSKALYGLLGSAAATIVAALLLARTGLGGMLATLAVVALVLVHLPILIDERRFSEPQPATLPLVAAVRATLRNRPFVIALCGLNTFWLGFNLVVLNAPLYVTVLLGQGEAAIALYMTAVFATAAVAFPVVNAAAKRHGPRRVLLVSLTLSAVVYPALYWLPTPPFGLATTTFGLAVFAGAGFGLAGLFVLPDAIVAAVADHGTHRSGQRREAMYFGVNGFVVKVTFGVATVVSAVLLQTFGSPLGIQLTGPVGAAAALLGVWLFLRYPEQEVQATARTSPVPTATSRA